MGNINKTVYLNDCALRVKDKPGVYMLGVIETGDFYIGATSTSFLKRANLHRSELRNDRHHNKKLQKYWDLNYTFVMFSMGVFEDFKQLQAKEAEYIERFFNNQRCLNGKKGNTGFLIGQEVDSSNLVDAND